MKMKQLLIALTVSTGLSTVALAQDSDNNNLSNIDTGSVMVDGNVVSGVDVQIDRPGFLVLHDEANGAPPNSLGVIAVQPEGATNVRVEAEEMVDMANNPSLMLYYDTNANETFDHGMDTPAIAAPVPIAVP